MDSIIDQISELLAGEEFTMHNSTSFKDGKYTGATLSVECSYGTFYGENYLDILGAIAREKELSK